MMTRTIADYTETALSNLRTWTGREYPQVAFRVFESREGVTQLSLWTSDADAIASIDPFAADDRWGVIPGKVCGHQLRLDEMAEALTELTADTAFAA